MRRRINTLVARRGVMIAVSGLIALAGGVFVVSERGYPDPVVADEFAYLLGADTFASGRMTNPTHPLWIFFETLHVIVRPTYQMMYPPLQSVMLAAGQVVAGHPWWGVWISAGLMSAVMCWMLYAWLPPRWAVLGSLIYAVRVGAFGYWMDSYWGGAVAAIGGAFVLGALPRIKTHRRRRDAALMAVGVAILANTRPYEGFILVAVVAASLLWWIRQSKPGYATVNRQIVMPMILVLVPTATMMCVYFQRVTGDPFLMPYQVARRTYGIRPAFLGLAPYKEPTYNHKELREEYRFELRENLSALRKLRAKVEGPTTFFFSAPLVVPFVMLPWMLGDRRIRLLLWMAPVMALGLLLEQWVRPHYVAPFAGLLYVVLVQAMRHLRQVRVVGMRLGVVAFWLVLVVFAARQIPRVHSRFEEGWSTHRANIIRSLEQTPDRHLIVVHYDPTIALHRDWLANTADIDNAKVVWAREMDAADMRRLVDYFRKQGRRLWVIDADTLSAPLRPLSDF